MHHTISYQLASARIAELRHSAQRHTLACAARRARPGQRRPYRVRRAGPWRPDPAKTF